MRLEEQYVPPASKLMSDYINNEGSIREFFSYEPSANSFESRLKELKKHNVDRARLSGILRSYMQTNGISDAAEAHISAFENGAPVIVTGQQAGLLTGPLYTVHKAISVIVLAKQASEQLGTKVVPVFWIAGEDHDLAEISHLYREVNGRLDKLNFPHTEYGKKTASTAVLNKTKLRSYLEEYFRSFPETEYTNDLKNLVYSFMDQSETFTCFFSSFLNYFFREEGLLYIDAADPELRAYESSYFIEMINKSEDIAKNVEDTEKILAASGYGAAIEAQANAANLFVTVKGERILLERDGDKFTGNHGAVVLTRQELLEMAENQPQNLSNNVVTRPLMQEKVFPVLAFVGGPGEIAYWAALKGAFGLMEMEMPVVMPRLGMTLVNRQAQALMEKHKLSFSNIVIEQKIPMLRNELFDSLREKEAESLLKNIEEKLKEDYGSVNEQFSNISKGLSPLVEKNLQFHLKQLEFLKQKLQDEVILQNATEFHQYTRLENELRPESNFQERVYSPYPYLNGYGLDLIQRLAKLDFKYDKNHKIVYL